MNWTVDIVDEQGEPTLRKSIARINGLGAKAFFAAEHGVHKLTRVSPYGNGKKHTSCASVSALHEVVEAAAVILDKDVRWDTFRGTGAGGQHRNKRDTAVRLTHLPTWTVVTILSGRSQHQNKLEAMSIMRAKLQEIENKAISAKTRLHINRGSSGFGHQVRTYKLDQQMVRDERTGLTHHQPQKVLDGELEWLQQSPEVMVKKKKMK
jgi:peptide chain release factor 2